MSYYRIDFDGFDLGIKLEDIFRISIPDKEAEKIRTLEQLQKAILSRVATVSSNNRCIGQHAFYELRHLLGDYFNRDSHTIRPDTLTEDIIPRNKRGVIWRDLERKSGLEFPTLFAPRKLLLICMAIYFMIVLIMIFISSTVFPSLKHLIWTLGLPGGIFAVIIIFLLEIRFASKVPECCVTIGGLAKAIKAHNLLKLSEGHFTEKDVLEAISTIMACGFNVGYDAVDVPKDTKLIWLESAIVKKRKELLKKSESRNVTFSM
jgi:hypothetical protein